MVWQHYFSLLSLYERQQRYRLKLFRKTTAYLLREGQLLHQALLYCHHHHIIRAGRSDVVEFNTHNLLSLQDGSRWKYACGYSSHRPAHKLARRWGKELPALPTLPLQMIVNIAQFFALW